MSTNTRLIIEAKNIFAETQKAFNTLVEKYCTDDETSQKIKKNPKRMNTSIDESLHKTKRRKKLEIDEYVSRELLKWYKERQMQGYQITDISMLEKALKIKACKTPTDDSDLELNFRWIAEFVKKNIKRLGEIDAYILYNNLKPLMESQNVHIENIYNMSETQLLWQALPINTSTEKQKENIRDYELRKNRITIALCTNVSGKNKVTPFIVYDDETQQQHFTQDTVSLPCRFHKDAKMDQKLFIDWFENYFKPSARKHQKEKRTPSKVILFIDDRKTHKVLSEYQNSENYEIWYIPKRTAPLIQPMDCGIMKSIKTLFRYYLLCRVQQQGVNNFHESYCLKDCVDILQKSWKFIVANSIQHAWLKILPCLATFYTISPRTMKNIYNMLKKVVSEIIEVKCTEDDIREYISKCEEAENENEEQTNDSIIDSE